MALLTKMKDRTGIKIDPRFEKLPLKSLFVISVITNTIFILISFVSQLLLPPVIPLFYGLPKNAEQLAASLFIVVPSVIAIVFTIINAMISIKVEGQYLKRTLAFASISITLLSVVATYKIIFLVGSI